jgi:hypothetical protein
MVLMGITYWGQVWRYGESPNFIAVVFTIVGAIAFIGVLDELL